MTIDRPEKNSLLNMKKFLNQFTLALFFYLAFSTVALAQGIPGAGVNTIVEPKNPAAFETILITLESFSTDLNQADIKWYLNGALKKQGKAVKTFETLTGDIGTSLTIEAVINTKNIGTLTKKVIIAPTEIDIIEQADSFVPPFYKGKALASTEGNVTLISLPLFVTSNGKKLSSNDIVFKWKRNGRVLPDESGLGRNSIAVDVPYIKEAVVKFEVEATAPVYNLIATESHFVQPENPEIIFYENNPLLGIMFNKALKGTLVLNKDEAAITAYPFFFGEAVISDRNTNFRWSINGKTVTPTGGKRNSMTLRRPAGATGVSVVSLSIENTKRVFETASQSLRIDLGNSSAKSVEF